MNNALQETQYAASQINGMDDETLVRFIRYCETQIEMCEPLPGRIKTPEQTSREINLLALLGAAKAERESRYIHD